MEKIIPLLSIIVPVYNVEQYLSRCIDSILGQTFQDFELILIDDGSSDRSGSICDEYANQDSRIKVIHKKNEGVSIARNKGLDIACGKYITFVDSDDELGTSMTLEENIMILKTHPEFDIVQYPIGNSQQIPQVYTQNRILEAIISKQITGYLWGKIYKTTLFSYIRLPKHIYFAEDTWCLIDLVDYVQNIYISDKGSYFYRMREGSAVNTFTPKQCLNLFQMSFHLFEKIRKTDYFPIKINVKYFFVTYKRLLNARIVNSDDFNYSVYIKVLSDNVPNYIWILKKGLNLKQKIWLLLMKSIGCKTFAYLYVYFVKWRLNNTFLTL